jgi:diguanylate cyclase (GGDEF)-like protein
MSVPELSDRNRRQGVYKMHILVADDSGISRHIICALLREWGHHVVSVNDGHAALHALRSDIAISLALVDWMMPGLDGLEVCQQLRAIPDRPYTYMISVTSRTEKEDLVSALEAGFDDFLTKPVDPSELNARLLVGRRIVDLQRKLMDACEQSQFKATHDSLTGLWNRGAILEFLRAHLAMATRRSGKLALIMLDVDHFKKINDTYGHSVGDSALIHLSHLMNSVVRASDWVGRYGGEEFLIIASECPAEDAIQLAERIRLAVVDNPLSYGQLTISSSVSIGIANMDSIASPTPESLIKLADSALYRAKNNGRNRIEVDLGCKPCSMRREIHENQALDSVT